MNTTRILASISVANCSAEVRVNDIPIFCESESDGEINVKIPINEFILRGPNKITARHHAISNQSHCTVTITESLHTDTISAVQTAVEAPSDQWNTSSLLFAAPNVPTTLLGSGRLLPIGIHDRKQLIAATSGLHQAFARLNRARLIEIAHFRIDDFRASYGFRDSGEAYIATQLDNLITNSDFIIQPLSDDLTIDIVGHGKLARVLSNDGESAIRFDYLQSGLFAFLKAYWAKLESGDIVLLR